MTNQRLLAATENYQAKKHSSMTLDRSSQLSLEPINHNSERLAAIASQQQEQRHTENLILLHESKPQKISNQERQIAVNSLHSLKHRQASVMVRSPKLD